MTSQAIETFAVEHDFGSEPVLQGLSMRVPRGSVYGLLGRNGSGKTTLIRMLLDLLRPRAGRCEVLGLDPTRDGLAVRARVGYMPQEFDFDPRMTVRETLGFLRSFYPQSWRDDAVEEHLRRFEVPSRPRVGNLSVGQRRCLALVAALAFEPEVLILDEPTAGLDAVVRRDFTEAVIELMTREGRSVLLASHLLGEVERLADHVGIIEDGRMLVESSVEALKLHLSRVTARFPRPPDRLGLPELVSCRRLGDRWQLAAWTRSPERRDELLESLAQLGAVDVSLSDSSLESIFVDLVGSHHDA